MVFAVNLAAMAGSRSRIRNAIAPRACVPAAGMSVHGG
jgi:hypothetical protein